jgi:nitrate/TMAO reductase-like tetraheme cytochrome c subunit
MQASKEVWGHIFGHIDTRDEFVQHFMAGDAECFRIREFERGIKSAPENHSCEKSTKDEVMRSTAKNFDLHQSE